MNDIILNWSTPISINGFKNSIPQIRGVYVWGFHIGDKFVPYYVGEGNNVFLRIIDHVEKILSGRYIIYHKDCFFEIEKYKESTVSDFGKIYSPKWPVNFHEFLENRIFLQTHINFMIDNFCFIYAEVSIEKVVGLKSIESQCVFDFNKRRLANIKGGSKSEISLTHINLPF